MAKCADPSIYPSEYHTQSLKEYCGQEKESKSFNNTRDARNARFAGILSGGLSSLGDSSLDKIGYEPKQGGVQKTDKRDKLDILEAAKRKLIKSLVEESPMESYYSGLLDLVREYDSEWAYFYDGISGARPAQDLRYLFSQQLPGKMY